MSPLSIASTTGVSTVGALTTENRDPVVPVRLPRYTVGKATPLGALAPLQATLRSAGLNTVCEEARCPNRSDCFPRGVATFMILGETCTRTCTFCSVSQGTPNVPDPDEPQRVALAAKAMGLRHVVVTSVDRDDLPDLGAGAFVATIQAVRAQLPDATVEVLTPDFQGQTAPVDAVAAALPTVYNHNMETIPRLYAEVRPAAIYKGSLDLLARVRHRAPGVVTKSGLMVGLGETDAELTDVFRDLADVGCDVLTIGQYLRPTRRQRPVHRYVDAVGFAGLREAAQRAGIAHVVAGPRVRSSYYADAVLDTVRRRAGKSVGRGAGRLDRMADGAGA